MEVKEVQVSPVWGEGKQQMEGRKNELMCSPRGNSAALSMGTTISPHPRSAATPLVYLFRPPASCIMEVVIVCISKKSNTPKCVLMMRLLFTSRTDSV